jgi:hypothetical protein
VQLGVGGIETLGVAGALAERSPGMRIRLAFWSSARPMAWRIQNVA